MGLQLGGGVPPRAVCAKRRGQARGRDIAGAGKAAEEVVIGMPRKLGGDPRVERLDRADERP